MVDEKPQLPLSVANLSGLPAEALRSWAKAVGAEVTAPGPNDALPTTRAPLILVYDSVETALTAAMARGGQPSSALKEWEDRAGSILAFWRQRRRVTFLLESDSLLADPAGAAAAVATWRGAPAPADLALPDTTEAPQSAPVLAALAALPRLSRRTTRRLCDELAAGGFCRALDAVDFLDDAVASLAKGQSGVSGAMSARNTAAEQLGTTQADLDVRKARLDALVAESGRHLDAGQEQGLSGWQNLAAAEVLAQESELRRIQLLSLQEMLESIQKKHASEAHKQASHIAALEMDVLRLRAQLQERLQTAVALSDANRRLELQLEDRDQEIKAVRSSQSWRITAPLRATRLLLSGRRKPR